MVDVHVVDTEFQEHRSGAFVDPVVGFKFGQVIRRVQCFQGQLHDKALGGIEHFGGATVPAVPVAVNFVVAVEHASNLACVWAQGGNTTRRSHREATKSAQQQSY